MLGDMHDVRELASTERLHMYTSMYIHEEHPSLVDDPAFLSEGTRLYRRKTNETGKANLPVTDVVVMADNIVQINPSKLPVVKDALSQLSEAEARNNRLAIWNSKERVYKRVRSGW